MKFEIGAMSVGDILDRGLKIFWARWPTFYAISLIVMAPALVFNLVLPVLLTNLQQTNGEPNLALLLGFLLSDVAVLVITLLLIPIGGATILYVVGQEYIDHRVGVREAFAFAFRRFGTLLAVAFLVGLMKTFGSCLGIVPGVIFAVWYAFATQVVVMERLGATDSMGRSKDLGEGYFWRIFGVLALLLVIALMVLAVSLTLDSVFKPGELVMTDNGFQYVIHSYPLYVVTQLVNFLLQSASESYSAVCVTLLYFDLRIRKEGFDLELAARKSGGLEEEPGAA